MRLMGGQPPSAVRRPPADAFDFDVLDRCVRKQDVPENKMTTRPIPFLRRAFHCALLCLAVCLFAGAGDPASRFKDLGHQLMRICGCHQSLLECNQFGCPDSDMMRNELMAAVGRGDSDSLVEQAFVQKY